MKNIFLVLTLASSLLLGGCRVIETASDGINPSFHSGVFSSVTSLDHDWKEINIAGGDVEHTFTLTNNESETLLLDGAVTSCMCTTAEFKMSDGSDSGSFGMHGGPEWSYEVQPGESFDVRVIFDPMAHGPTATGPIRRTVNVISKPDPSSSSVVYTPINVSGDVLSEADFNNL